MPAPKLAFSGPLGTTHLERVSGNSPTKLCGFSGSVWPGWHHGKSNDHQIRKPLGEKRLHHIGDINDMVCQITVKF